VEKRRESMLNEGSNIDPTGMKHQMRFLDWLISRKKVSKEELSEIQFAWIEHCEEKNDSVDEAGTKGIGGERTLTGNVFIVEDEPDFIDIYRRIFEPTGVRIMGHARSGEEALEKLAKSTHRPDLIIMDHHLPGMTGVDTTLKILEADPTASVLFVSVDDHVRRLALESGAVGFISKPFSLEKFISSVIRHCGGSDGRIRTRKERT
jgi:CheY-like chemotaxis protein